MVSFLFLLKFAFAFQKLQRVSKILGGSAFSSSPSNHENC